MSLRREDDLSPDSNQVETEKQPEFLKTVLGVDLDNLIKRALETGSITPIIEALNLQKSPLAANPLSEKFELENALYQGYRSKPGKIGSSPTDLPTYKEAIFCVIGETQENQTVRLVVRIEKESLIVIRYFWQLVDPKKPSGERKMMREVYQVAHQRGKIEKSEETGSGIDSFSTTESIHTIPTEIKGYYDPTPETEKPPTFIEKLAALIAKEGQTTQTIQDQIVAKAQQYYEADRRWEIVRRYREGFLLKGATLAGEPVRTGLGGYYVGRGFKPDQIIEAIANEGIALLEKIKENCRQVDVPSYLEVRNTLDRSQLSLPALRLLEKLFVELVNRLRQEGQQHSEYNTYRNETAKMVKSFPVKELTRDSSGKWREEKLISTPAEADPRPIDDLLSDEQKVGLKLMMEIGVLGNSLVRATLELAPQEK